MDSRRLVDRGGAVVNEVHDVLVLAQSFDEETGDRPVVLDE